MLQIDSKNQQVSASKASCQTIIHLFPMNVMVSEIWVFACTYMHICLIYFLHKLCEVVFGWLWQSLSFSFWSTSGALRHSLQDRLSKSSGKIRDEIYLKLRTSTGSYWPVFYDCLFKRTVVLHATCMVLLCCSVPCSWWLLWNGSMSDCILHGSVFGILIWR